MRKVCVVTGARSEYGLLKWFMKEIEASNKFELQLIVTGGHLLKSQGHTIDHIIEDGFKVDKIVDCDLDTSSAGKIAESMGRMGEGFAKTFEELKPDYVVVLGDRYELLPICSSAFVMRIPIIHIGGGDVTTGAIDDGVRNAITMLAEYHFVGTQASGDNIVRMRNSDRKVWVVGETGLDAFACEELMIREELAKNLGLDLNKRWVLMTYHSETMESIDFNLSAVKNCIHALDEVDDLQVVASYSNADLGGTEINDYLETIAAEKKDKFIVIPSLGRKRYLSYMKQVDLVIGNSSSGILEAPAVGVPVVNIGNRQDGRHQCNNIIQCDTSFDAIFSAIKEALGKNRIVDSYWGDGKSSQRIVKIMESQLAE